MAESGAGQDADGEGDATGAPGPVQVQDRAEFDAILAEHGTVLVDFYADWCGPCKLLDPTIDDLAAESSATVTKVDVDEHEAIAAEFGIGGVPTLILFHEGSEVDRFVGLQTGDALREAIAEVG